VGLLPAAVPHQRLAQLLPPPSATPDASHAAQAQWDALLCVPFRQRVQPKPQTMRLRDLSALLQMAAISLPAARLIVDACQCLDRLAIPPHVAVVP